MLKRVVLIVGFLSTFSSTFAQHETAVIPATETAVSAPKSHEVTAPISEADKIKTENSSIQIDIKIK